MPPLSSLPSISRERFINTLIRLGWIIKKRGGKGSHCKLEWPPTSKAITVKKNFDKDTLSYLIKEIEKYSSLTWEQIEKEL
ncbi:MAG TPA: type II toxin-antitoxin system HicA family toxin [Patescibacteria group bacterium]|nr:type II toxin-antitoxin system HicA family toxin [Patescibacteria group bacterium]